MKWPQIVIIVLFTLGWVIELYKHGEPKKPGKHDIGMRTASVALVSWLLWMGGFFQ